ncbi:MAG: hypothetical protein ABIX01_17750 [Chitinophagaceae bacterium]
MPTHACRRILMLLICCTALAGVQGQKKIFKAEYFFDTDPGFNNANQVLVPTPVQTVSNLNINPNISDLSTGLHTLFVRVLDSNFMWSQTIPQLFYKEANLAINAPALTQVEYFVDTDPGFGLGIQVSVTAATGTVFTPSLNTLSNGLHNLFVRTRDANGKWSQTVGQLFFKEANLATTAPNLVKLEYFVDNEPGFGLATDVPVAAAAALTGTAFTPSLTGLSNGLHNLFVRTLDANGRWSQTSSQLFFKEANLATTAPTLVKLEYFVDSDPGFGLGMDVPVVPATSLTGAAFIPSLIGLSNGLHNLFVRTLDANGKWSQTSSQLFFKEANLGTTAPNLVKLEYFVDTDPGFGLATDVPVTAATSLAGTAFAPALTGLSKGLHNLFVRTLDANGKWSQSISQLFFNEADLFVPAQNLVKLEYFIDSDPGFGSATDVPVTPNTTLSGVNFVPNISALKIGLHWLSVRAKEQGGKWGQTTHQLFYYEPVRGPYRPRIIRAEYYFDDFAAVGSGIPVVLAPKDTVSGIQFPVNVTGLAAGNHRFFLRTLSDSGRWSLTAYKDITVISTASGSSILVNSFTPNTVCAGNSIDVAFHSTGNYVPGNAFTLQMSDGSGLFGSPVNLGSITSTVSGIIKAVVPPATAPNSYKLRVISSNVAVTGTTSDSSLAVLGVSQSFRDSTIYLNCFNDTYNLTNLYNVTNGGVWNTLNPTVAPPGMYKYYVTAGGGCSDTADITLKLEVATWTGTLGNDWHVAGNWNINKVPGLFTHVIIPAGIAIPCIISGADAMAASVQARGIGNFQIINNRKLVINGVCQVLPPN